MNVQIKSKLILIFTMLFSFTIFSSCSVVEEKSSSTPKIPSSVMDSSNEEIDININYNINDIIEVNNPNIIDYIDLISTDKLLEAGSIFNTKNNNTYYLVNNQSSSEIFLNSNSEDTSNVIYSTPEKIEFFIPLENSNKIVMGISKSEDSENSDDNPLGIFLFIVDLDTQEELPLNSLYPNLPKYLRNVACLNNTLYMVMSDIISNYGIESSLWSIELSDLNTPPIKISEINKDYECTFATDSVFICQEEYIYWINPNTKEKIILAKIKDPMISGEVRINEEFLYIIIRNKDSLAEGCILNIDLKNLKILNQTKQFTLSEYGFWESDTLNIKIDSDSGYIFMNDYYDLNEFEYIEIEEYDLEGNLVYKYPKIYGNEAPLFNQFYTKSGILYYIYNGSDKINELKHL